MTTIHPSMMPAMADDLAAYNKAVGLANQFASDSGWGTNVTFDITVNSPSGKTSVPSNVVERLTNEEKSFILDVLFRAQTRNVNTLVEKLKEHYGVEVEKRG